MQNTDLFLFLLSPFLPFSFPFPFPLPFPFLFPFPFSWLSCFEIPDISSGSITSCHSQLVGIKSKKRNWSCHPKHHVSISINSKNLRVGIHLPVIGSAFRIFQDLILSKCHYIQHSSSTQLFMCIRADIRDIMSGKFMYLKLPSIILFFFFFPPPLRHTSLKYVLHHWVIRSKSF